MINQYIVYHNDVQIIHQY